MKSKIIAVTGGIGSGKSEAVRYLRSLGYPTVDCDDLAREVSDSLQTVEQVRQLLGEAYVVDGRLNRKAIREKVFSDAKLLRRYNAIFFDEIKKILDERIALLRNQSRVFVEISVFDAFDYEWDAVWLVEADLTKRIERVAKRDGSERGTIEAIIQRQCVCDDYTLKLVNDGDIDALKKQIDDALKTV